jgi:enoyl-CoA hydratase
MDVGVQVEAKGDVCCVRLDDGKVNALSQPKLEAIAGAVERAEKEAKALLLLGRPGRFSAGFDLSVMRGGGRDALTALVRAGMELGLRLRESPLPVVIGCTGHALAMGAVLLMAADERIGARGDFKIGLNETAIGMTLPRSAVEIVRERLAKPYLERAVVAAEVYAPEQALEAGFLDRLADADAVERTAFARAAALAELPRRAYGANKRLALEPTLARIRHALQQDFESLA